LQSNKNTFNTSLQDLTNLYKQQKDLKINLSRVSGVQNFVQNGYLVKVATEPIEFTLQHSFQIAYPADWGVHWLALADLCEHRRN
jgi:hypothetical protein